MRGPNEYRRRGGRRRRLRRAPASLAAAGETLVAQNMRPERLNVDLVVFADQLARRVRPEPAAAPFAHIRHVLGEPVGLLCKLAVVRLVAGLGTARPRILARLFHVGGRRLGRRARRLVRPLKPENQLDQLLFAELLQITSIHSIMDSGIYPADKGVGNYALIEVSTEFLHGRSNGASHKWQEAAAEPAVAR